jgi:hypothetical protein
MSEQTVSVPSEMVSTADPPPEPEPLGSSSSEPQAVSVSPSSRAAPPAIVRIRRVVMDAF